MGASQTTEAPFPVCSHVLVPLKLIGFEATFGIPNTRQKQRKFHVLVLRIYERLALMEEYDYPKDSWAKGRRDFWDEKRIWYSSMIRVLLPFFHVI
ncbi:hypothetical protein L596_014153 [Steinernema carpocapsae]|uniref:Uncharacterized protein n=1 Tax=Steinernema carpocapsae TaxID=34508 RepID=A0A4V6A2Q1_STECR|nr:hypothetical protein L596_014153 [Steinernema carpocapsae]